MGFVKQELIRQMEEEHKKWENERRCAKCNNVQEELLTDVDSFLYCGHCEDAQRYLALERAIDEDIDRYAEDCSELDPEST